MLVGETEMPDKVNSLLPLRLMVLYWIFISAVVLQCGYALFFFARVLRLPVAVSTSVGHRAGVSIVICAKNEAAQLQKNLPAILSQQYEEPGESNFEVVVVNDASTDNTAEVLAGFAANNDRLKIVTITADAPREFKGKKFALSKGVKAALYEHLLLTDADCVPASDQWLGMMMAPLTQGKEIIAGYGGYNRSGGLLNAFTRWETLHTFLQYSTYLLAGVPYMAVGRNMACTKSVLLQAMRSDVWNEIPSGDDDLLVSIAATNRNMAIVSDEAAFTYTDAKSTWAEWARQKQRHLSTGKYYKTLPKVLLGLYGISHAALWLCFFLLVGCVGPLIALMSVRCLLYWGLWCVTAYKVKEQSLIYLFPFFDIGWLIYNFAFLPYITLKNKQHWT